MNSSSETTNSGSHANRTGNRLERFVEEALKEHKYVEFWNHKKQIFENRRTIGGKQYAKQVPVGETIYGGERKADFLVLNNEKWEEGLMVECKWQQSSGSVHEKYPFLCFNIMKTGVPTVILLDGGGYPASAEEWLKGQADPKRALVAVWDMSKFQREVNNGFLG